MKLWGGRFTKTTDELASSFNSSIKFDYKLYKYDILGSIAHAKMLGKCGIIPLHEAELIQDALKNILENIESGIIKLNGHAGDILAYEDIHSFIESILVSRIGDVGKKLHTARSRNDQVALDTRMFVKDAINEIKSLLASLGSCLVKLAENNLDTILPGYTHLQRAQPVTLAHHAMAYFQMFRRDIERLSDCYKRVDVMPLGSGALAGTTYPIDREMVAKELGFSSISENSLDAVSDRDYIMELLSCLSIIMMHLSRYCEELVLWSSHEFGFIEMDDSFSTGSSIMPQKKNPDIAELVRGKTGRVYGSLAAVLTMMKALPLAYNKDMQEDKEALFDAIDTVKACLQVFTGMLSTIKIHGERMYNAARGGFTNATDVADYLVKKGIAFRDAHEITGKIVLYCIKTGKTLEELTIDEFKIFSPIIQEDIYDEINLEKCVSGRNIPGGPSRGSVIASIAKAREFLEQIK